MNPLRNQKQIVLPFTTEAAALTNIQKIVKPEAFESIEHKFNEERGRWEVILTPKK